MTTYHADIQYCVRSNDRWCDILLALRPFIWSALLALVFFVSGAAADPPAGGAQGGAAAPCSPNPNGNPGCSGAGNPVNLATGNKYQHEIDLAPLPGVLGLRFERHYNSGSRHRGLTGIGWRSSYEIVLVDLGAEVQIIDADGTRRTFAKDPQHASVCVSSRPEDGRLLIAQDKDQHPDRRTYRWQRLDGAEYVFGHGTGGGHPLQSMVAASGERVTLNYLGGALDSVRDAQGRELKFVYERGGTSPGRDRALTLSAIDTPIGRLLYARDERGRLATITQPNTLVRRYHYEAEHQSGDPYLLTGMSVEYKQDGTTRAERIATYRYDARGRAVRTQHAGGDDLTLSYDEARNQITVTPTGGVATSSTVYRRALIAGQWTVVEGKGPGCSSCPPANVRYVFNRAGQREREEQLDARGQPEHATQTRFDASGRPLRIERIEYRNGKPTVTRLLLRAEYGETTPSFSTTSAAVFAASWRPQLVARPSVVPGREHTLAFTYNQQLQTTSVTERGFSPLDDSGRYTPHELLRTTSYRYQMVAGASRLIALDGPLPGVADTTKFHYDELGRLRLTQHPLPDLQERFSYDAAGRITLHIPKDAVPVRTRYPDGAQTLATDPLLPAAIERAGRTTGYQFNARGWVTHWSDGPQRAVSLAYNSEGRVIEAKDAQGNRVTWNRDEAKRLEATLWFDASQANAATPSPQRGYYRWFDAADRTLRTLAADGRVDDYVYDAQGRLTQHFDSDGVTHLYRARHDANGQLQARIDWAPDDEVRLFMWGSRTRGSTNAPSTTAATPQSALRDDFGRIVRIDLREHGARVAQHDAANQIKRIVFADGAKVEYEHDAAGRMIGKIITGADGQHESTVTLRYHGAYLIEVIDPAQNTAYRYDSAGRKVETRITLTALTASTSTPTYTIGTVFDAQGQPLEHRLADGRTMMVERDAAILVPSALTLKAHGLQPAQPIVTSISAHPFNGITGFTHGNGLVTTRSYDSAGRLTALTTSGVLDLRYEHKAGPRIRAIRDGASKPAQTAAGGFDYDGFGALRTGVAMDRTERTAPARAGVVRTSFGDRDLTASTAARDARGRLRSDEQHSYRYDALDRLIAVHEHVQNRLIARYTYNAFGERVAKTTIDAQGQQTTRQFLYHHNKLVAEIAVNDDGAATHIERQYIYLNQAPVAVLEAERVLAIHTDHRGAPLAMTDAQQRIVWRATYRDAWGEVQAVDAPSIEASTWQQLLHRASGGRLGKATYGAATLNLRLPGQYADAETGLHYNLHRYYDPRRSDAGTKSGVQRASFDSKSMHGQGRYLTPDPLGHPDGPDPYLYASGDPINKIDRLGLYEEDVHYYMTYFLALVAGLPAQQAWVIASANRYIDDNPFTEPRGRAYLSFEAREKYHFTQDGHDPAPLPGDVTVIPGYWMIGYLGPEWVPARTVYSASYIDRRMRNPVNDQLTSLHGYAVNAPTPCAKAQLYGEYLHAYMDTFAHRDRNNVPYGSGIGHGLDAQDPDKTYNHGAWQVNETRTLAMEQQVFAAFQRDFGRTASGPDGFPIEWRDIELTMIAFNRDQTQPDGAEHFALSSSKIRILNDRLTALGLPSMDIYNRERANRCRVVNLRDADGRPLRSVNYPGTILQTENAAEYRDARCERA